MEKFGIIMCKMPAANGRFHASGGVSPQKHLYKFASASPARTFVNPRLREAAGTLLAMQGLESLKGQARRKDNFS